MIKDLVFAVLIFGSWLGVAGALFFKKIGGEAILTTFGIAALVTLPLGTFLLNKYSNYSKKKVKK